MRSLILIWKLLFIICVWIDFGNAKLYTLVVQCVSYLQEILGE